MTPLKSSAKQRLIWILLCSLLTLGADQAAKIWAKSTLKGNDSIVLIENYLELDYHENPGSAFGMFRSLPYGRYILIALGIFTLAFLVFWIIKTEHRYRTGIFAFGLVLGGAVGNIVDRIYIGRVVDFIVMHWQRKFVWPAYNVADAALVVGIILLTFVLGRKAGPISAGSGKSKAKSRRR